MLRTGAAAEAKKLVEDDARDAPDYLPNQVFLMKIACAEKRDDDCAARVEKSWRRIFFNYDALFESGISSLGKGDATQAIRIFEQLSDMTKILALDSNWRSPICFTRRAPRGRKPRRRSSLQ